MVAVNSSLTIWERILLRDDRDLSPETACYVLQLDFSPADHARMEELNAGAAAGTLPPAEREELADYVRVGHQLALLQSRARASLRRLTAATNGHG